jgi:hypothetical protein
MRNPIIPVVEKGGGQPYEKGQYQRPECNASSSVLGPDRGRWRIWAQLFQVITVWSRGRRVSVLAEGRLFGPEQANRDGRPSDASLGQGPDRPGALLGR